MKSGIPEIVHVILAGEEVDRAVCPFETVPAGRVIVIAGAGDSPAPDCTSKILAALKKKHIRAEKVEPESTDTAGLMKVTASVIKREKEEGNTVYVNMSAAGKKGAAVATLVGMALGAEVYYVPLKQTAGSVTANPEQIELLPSVEILLPDDTETSILHELYVAEESSLSASEISNLLDDDVPGKDENYCMNDLVLENNRPDFYEERKIQSRNLMKVSNFMKKLEEKGYVSKGKTGRKMMYRITEKGRNVLLLSGILE